MRLPRSPDRPMREFLPPPQSLQAPQRAAPLRRLNAPPAPARDTIPKAFRSPDAVPRRLAKLATPPAEPVQPARSKAKLPLCCRGPGRAGWPRGVAEDQRRSAIDRWGALPVFITKIAVQRTPELSLCPTGNEVRTRWE